MATQVFPALDVEPPDAGFARADLVFDGVEQAGSSYEVRVFLNHETANAGTPRTDAEGYAGAFHVYGYGAAAEEDTGRAVLALEKRLIATGALRRALDASNRLVVSIVTIPESAPSTATSVRVTFERE